MFTDGSTADNAVTKTLHTLEFRGSGGEYFRIWIVNIALTIITLGIYSAWAKVRSTRYFRGNTFLAGHPFDYHASPVRILIGRLIAVTMLFGYSISAKIHPLAALGWGIFFLFVAPWLIVSSLRFNARNTSYRNVRFNFVGSLGGAAKVFILFPLLSALTLFTTIPLVHRARDYFLVNNHTFGGKHLHTEFSGWSIYRIYLIGIAASIGVVFVVGIVAGIAFYALTSTGLFIPNTKPTPQAMTIIVLVVVPLYLLFLFALIAVQVFVRAMTMNLALSNTTLDRRHELRSMLQPLRLAWITVTNTLLTLVTIGLFYPWAAVRLARYEISRFAVLAASDLDEFTSEAIATQGAIGEEIANFFDLGISL